jgi:hypothetical protein
MMLLSIAALTFRVIDAETVELNLVGQQTSYKCNVQSGPHGELTLSARGLPPFVLTQAS